jgi:hypothetical protein
LVPRSDAWIFNTREIILFELAGDRPAGSDKSAADGLKNHRHRSKIVWISGDPQG